MKTLHLPLTDTAILDLILSEGLLSPDHAVAVRDHRADARAHRKPYQGIRIVPTKDGFWQVHCSQCGLIWVGVEMDDLAFRVCHRHDEGHTI